ncbi:cyanate transporter [Pseudomonas sp. PCH199]|uniref:cyanate transporter n=1 Tax=unclassified Pseudomonas TaxID=196821 RepID=UPI000BD9D866|nr:MULTISPECIES: cyanate transporter [unclassified Pseudomonas]MCW8278573.1 cyanate transporter [Pseudomonas sp. PCH199]PAM81206.1 MFS transporter [Pseudomonas sp. ERMR1:02]
MTDRGSVCVATGMSRTGEVSLAALALLVLLGLNLRPFLTSVGPVLDLVRADIGLNFRAAAMLTTLPFVLMGLIAFIGIGVARRFGERQALAGALLLLMLGCASRAMVKDGAQLIAGAGIAGTGVALIQALIPGVAKRWFPERIAMVMGLYSAALVGGGALGSLASMWLHSYGGWRLGLSIWALPALAVLLLWLVCAPRTSPIATCGPAPVLTGSFFKNRRAWQLAAYFGFTNSGYSSLVAWLPSFYQQQNMGLQASGNLLAWLAMFQATAAFAMPMLARRSADRRGALWLTIALQAAGFAGFALAPNAAPWLWVALAGFGLGGFFSLSLIVSLDHLSGAQAAGALAAFVQGIGFLLASSAPWLIGWLRDSGASFITGWWLHVGVLAAMAVLTVKFAPATYRRSMQGV